MKKNIKRAVRLGVMAVMFNMMVTKVEAATYNGYEYYTGGNETSVTLIVDEDILEYRVEEENVQTGNIEYNTIEDYLVASDMRYPIPGLENANVEGENCTTMVPQGICRMDNYILITAYDKKIKYDSVIYVLSLDGKLKATLIYDKKCHMGGIAYDGTAVWIAEGDKGTIGVIKKTEINGAIQVAGKKNVKSVKIRKVESINPAGIENVSYCTYFDNMIWAGTFNRSVTSHIYGYAVSYGTKTKMTRKRYIQAPKKTQGITFANLNKERYMAISTSYGRENLSVIRCYNIKEYYDPEGEYGGVKQIKKGNAYRTLTIPPLSQQLTTFGAYMYFISESGATPYVDNADKKGKTENPMGYFCIFSTNSIFK